METSQKKLNMGLMKANLIYTEYVCQDNFRPFVVIKYKLALKYNLASKWTKKICSSESFANAVLMVIVSNVVTEYNSLFIPLLSILFSIFPFCRAS